MTKYPSPLPEWLNIAFSHVGLKEIPGKNHNPVILNWLIGLKAWWKEDETPWCGTFVAHCLKEAGIPYPKDWYRAKAYQGFGKELSLDHIACGAICVKSRVGGGHVFFAVSKSSDNRIIYGLGGNQSNMVNITAFKREEIDWVGWPPAPPGVPLLDLPLTTAGDTGVAPRGSEA